MSGRNGCGSAPTPAPRGSGCTAVTTAGGGCGRVRTGAVAVAGAVLLLAGRVFGPGPGRLPLAAPPAGVPGAVPGRRAHGGPSTRWARRGRRSSRTARPCGTSTHLPSDGVPLASVTNSMCQPDGTSARLPGTVTVIPPAVRFSLSATDRWSVSVTWVTAPGRISFAEVIARPLIRVVEVAEHSLQTVGQRYVVGVDGGEELVVAAVRVEPGVVAAVLCPGAVRAPVLVPVRDAPAGEVVHPEPGADLLDRRVVAPVEQPDVQQPAVPDADRGLKVLVTISRGSLPGTKEVRKTTLVPVSGTTGSRVARDPASRARRTGRSGCGRARSGRSRPASRCPGPAARRS